MITMKLVYLVSTGMMALFIIAAAISLAFTAISLAFYDAKSSCFARKVSDRLVPTAGVMALFYSCLAIYMAWDHYKGLAGVTYE